MFHSPGAKAPKTHPKQLEHLLELAKENATRAISILISIAGQLHEGREDWDLQAKDIHHRHVSHSVRPVSELAIQSSGYAGTGSRGEALAGDSRRSGDGMGYGVAHQSLGPAWRWRPCVQHFSFLLSPQRTYPDMFDAHPPFQIDAKFGGAVGIAEMLVQSHNGDVHFETAAPAKSRQGSDDGELAWRQHDRGHEHGPT